MSGKPLRSWFPVSRYATPSPAHQEVFYTVPRAGHLVAGPEHLVARRHFPGHELILCRRGQGWVRIAGRVHPVRPGELVWINCHHPHEHGAMKSDPWEVYWIRTEGPRLEQMCRILAVTANPVFTGFDHRAAGALYREIFGLMGGNAPEAPALIHARVAQLVALAFCARQRQPGPDVVVPAVLSKPVDRMRLFYFERHTVAGLAQLAGMSPTHFARVFKATFGTSPIDWLRRERISQAKRRLAETTAAIKEVAEQVGYGDRYFFSKDFRQHTGLSPRQFRQRERAEWRGGVAEGGIDVG
jgi:AraC-like DNA-binding protein